MGKQLVILNADFTYSDIYGEEDSTTYTINATASSASHGSVTGGGSYAAGTSVVLTATASLGYHFTKWSDGNTNNPRTVIVTGNKSYQAIFSSVPTYTITTIANPAEGGTISGGGTYDDNETVVITAVPNVGYEFKEWEEDGSTVNPKIVNISGEDVTCTAIFEASSGLNKYSAFTTSNMYYSSTVQGYTRTVFLFSVADPLNYNATMSLNSNTSLKVGVQTHILTSEHALTSLLNLDPSNITITNNKNAEVDKGWLMPGGTRTNESSDKNASDYTNKIVQVLVLFTDKTASTGTPSLNDCLAAIDTCTFSGLVPYNHD